MISAHISIILYIVGAITGIVTLQFFFPSMYARQILNIELRDDAAKFYFAHWGIMVSTLSILMILAADDGCLRKPVIAVTLLEKALLVAWITKDIKSHIPENLYLLFYLMP